MDNQYLSEFQIIGNSIKTFKIKNDFIALNSGNKTKRKIDVSHHITSMGTINDQKTFSGTIVLNIKVSIAEEKKKYSVDLSIEGCFNAPVEIGESNFKDMLKINGITSLYSIARGFIQSTTSQTLTSGSVLLPMFNVVAYSKDLDSETEK